MALTSTGCARSTTWRPSFARDVGRHAGRRLGPGRTLRVVHGRVRWPETFVVAFVLALGLVAAGPQPADLRAAGACGLLGAGVYSLVMSLSRPLRPRETDPA